jgi:glycosyltransferase involved in cell wall biosynthesis
MTEPLRIGINILFLLPGGVGGTEIYTRNLLQSLARVDSVNTYLIFRNRETEAGIVPEQSNFVDCPQPVRATFRPARIAYEQTGLVGAIVARKLDVVLNGGYTAPLLCPVPMVTVFYDLQYKEHPENFAPLDLLFWRLLLPASARRSRGIVTMSRAAREQLERYWPWSSDRISIVPHGIERRFSEIAIARDAKPPLGRYILAVSTLGPHKNYERLLHAFARYKRAASDVKLVVVGIKGSRTESLAALKRELNLNDDVTFTGWIPREELYDLYENALAFVYASTFEGFGIPVLEALAAGLPTTCSAIPSLLEIADGSARFFDPNDVGAIADSIHAVTAVPPDPTSIALGRSRAAAYGWEQSAGRLIETLRRATLPASARSDPMPAYADSTQP